MFFADKRVSPVLPKLLGKQFFKKTKLPLPVDLGHKNWKEHIERGCCSGLLFFRTGTCSVIRMAKVSMERDEIVENVMDAIDGVVEFVPKKLFGVRSLHLKCLDSVALPLYQSLPNIKLKIGGIQEKQVERVHDEVENNDSIRTVLNVDEVLDEAKWAIKKKREGDVMEGNDVNTKRSDKIAKKKGKKQNGDSEKKENKKGSLVSRV